MTLQTVSVNDINAILDAYPKDRRFALAAMQDMQRRYNYVPREGLEAMARHFGRPVSDLYSMATFYKALSLKPKGRHVIKVCDGTACHIRGSTNLIGGIRRALGIEPDGSTEDGEFSLELVNCVGACALAPVMLIDEIYYGKVKPESLPGIFEAVRSGTAYDEPDITAAAETGNADSGAARNAAAGNGEQL